MENRPNHYTNKELEPIEVIEDWNLGFHLGNVVKYIGRHNDKNGLDDLKKALWYLQREVDRREE